MALDKMTRLLLELVEKTNNGSLRWEGTAAEGVYQVSFPNFTVQISARGFDFVLTIRNAEGTILEEAADTEFSNKIQNPMATMNQLYVNARRQALGVDAALDNLLDELSKKTS
jgi:hypothetical protein